MKWNTTTISRPGGSPIIVLTVPDSYTNEEMETILDEFCATATEGTATVVVRGNVKVTDIAMDKPMLLYVSVPDDFTGEEMDEIKANILEACKPFLHSIGVCVQRGGEETKVTAHTDETLQLLRDWGAANMTDDWIDHPEDFKTVAKEFWNILDPMDVETP